MYLTFIVTGNITKVLSSEHQIAIISDNNIKLTTEVMPCELESIKEYIMKDHNCLSYLELNITEDSETGYSDRYWECRVCNECYSDHDANLLLETSQI